jgi:hypothetical protein
MNYKRKNDNIYRLGTVISTKLDPNVKLVIMKYIHNKYYCSELGNMSCNHKHRETDFIPPVTSI